MKKTFIIVGLSDNTNSFGLQQAVMVAKDGEAWEACKNPLFMPKVGDTVSLPYIKDANGELTNKISFAGQFEIPERLSDAPADVVEEAFKRFVS